MLCMVSPLALVALLCKASEGGSGPVWGRGRGRGGSRVVFWFGVPRAKDVWCSCLPRVEPPEGTGVARSMVDCVSCAVQRRG